MRDAACEASVDLAVERGAFPRFDAHRFLDAAGFAARTAGALRERIRVHGLRHAHLMAVAPAGSISLAFADNVSNGIEPVFAWKRSGACAMGRARRACTAPRTTPGGCTASCAERRRRCRRLSSRPRS
jgi:hypothetical protein